MGKLRQSPTGQAAANASDIHEKDAVDPIHLLEIAAHDLRNPISGILAASQYLLEDADPLLDEHHRALLQSIDSSSRSMLRLIEDVLELCNIESGKLRLDIKPTDIQPLLKRALLSGQAAAERKKVRIELEPWAPSLLPPLDIDPVRMLHAFESLILSAIKLARPGSSMEIGAGSRLGRVTIWLRTDGFGISALAMRSLFNPFRRGRTSRPGVEGGTALALAKVKNIVEAHGGVVKVENGESTGALIIKLAVPMPESAVAHKGAASAD
jgi:signal transduction histidine kinase